MKYQLVHHVLEGLKQYKLRLGINLEGVIIWIHPTTYEKLYTLLISKEPIYKKVIYRFQRLWCKIRKIRFDLRMDNIPIVPYASVPDNVILIGRPGEEGVSYFIPNPNADTRAMRDMS